MKKIFEKTMSYLIVFSMLLNYFAPLSVLAEENNLNESSGGIGGNLGNESDVVLDDNTVLDLTGADNTVDNTNRIIKLNSGEPINIVNNSSDYDVTISSYFDEFITVNYNQRNEFEITSNEKGIGFIAFEACNDSGCIYKEYQVLSSIEEYVSEKISLVPDSIKVNNINNLNDALYNNVDVGGLSFQVSYNSETGINYYCESIDSSNYSCNVHLGYYLYSDGEYGVVFTPIYEQTKDVNVEIVDYDINYEGISLVNMNNNKTVFVDYGDKVEFSISNSDLNIVDHYASGNFDYNVDGNKISLNIPNDNFYEGYIGITVENSEHVRKNESIYFNIRPDVIVEKAKDSIPNEFHTLNIDNLYVNSGFNYVNTTMYKDGTRQCTTSDKVNYDCTLYINYEYSSFNEVTNEWENHVLATDSKKIKVVVDNGLDGVTDGKIELDYKEIKTITGINGYTIDYIYDDNNNDVIDASLDNGVLTIQSLNYGVSNINLNMSDSTGRSFNVSFNVLVDLDGYVQAVLDRVPDKLEYDGNYFFDVSKYNVNDVYVEVDSEYIKQGDNYIQKYKCDTDELGNYTSCIIKAYLNYNDQKVEKTKKVDVVKTGLAFGFDSELSLSVDSSKTINLYSYGNTQIDYTKLVFISENNDIATVNGKGKVTGKSAGETKVRIYNESGNGYVTVNIKVNDGGILSAKEIAEAMTNKNIDASLDNDFYFGAEIKYQDYIQNYFRRLVTNSSIENQWSVTLNNDSIKCNVDENNYSANCSGTIIDTNKNRKYNFENFNVSIKGIYVPVREHNITGINNFWISYSTIGYDIDDVTFEYDSNYLEINKESNGATISPKKAGSSIVTLVVDSYSVDIKVNVKYFDQDGFYNYVNSLTDFVIPYGPNDNFDKNDLFIIENYINKYIIDNYPGDANDITVRTACLTNDSCTVMIQSPMGVNVRNLGISFSDEATFDSALVKEIDKNINNVYEVSYKDVVSLLKDNKNVYDELIKLTNIYSYVNSNQYDLVVSNRVDFEGPNGTYGGIKFNLQLKSNDKVVYDKDVVINVNSVVNMPVDLEHTTEARVSYLKSELSDILNNCDVQHLDNDVYTIKINDHVMKVILTQKDLEKIQSAYFTNPYMNVKVNESKKLAYGIYPSYANSGNISFDSSDKTVATVDENGFVTGHKKGFAVITASVGYSSSSIIVAVDSNIQELLNDFLLQFNENYIVEYSQLRYSSLENAISNSVRNTLYQSNNKFINNINIETVVEDNKAFVRAYIGYNENKVISDYKTINYTMKGIKVAKEVLEMSVGQTINGGIEFTEGDIYNLYFNVENEDVASIDKDGNITAKKAGYTNIYINDKYNTYYNTITVRVDYDSYQNEYFKKLKNEATVVDISSDYYGNAFDFWSNIDMNKVSSNVDCNLESNSCYISLVKYDYSTNDSTVVFEDEVPVRFVGIKVNVDNPIDYNNSVGLEVGDVYVPSITNLTGKELKYEVNDSSVCGLNNGVITAKKVGGCTVIVSAGEYYNKITIAVGSEQITDAAYDKFKDINEVDLNIDEFDLTNFANNEDASNAYYQLEGLIRYAVAKKLNLEFNSWDLTDPDSGLHYDFNIIGNQQDFSDNGYIIFDVSPRYEYNLNENNKYIYSSVNFGTTDRIKLRVNFKGFDDRFNDISKKLQSELKSEYYLTNEEYIAYTMNSGEYVPVWKYSSELTNTIDKYLDNYDLFVTQGGACGDEGYIQEEGTFVIVSDGAIVTTFETTVIGSISLNASDEFSSEEEYIELMKDEVRKAYLATIEDVNAQPMMMSMNTDPILDNLGASIFENEPVIVLLAGELDNDLEVTVSKKFDSQNGEMIYTFVIDGFTFKSRVKYNYEGQRTYTKSVTSIEVDKTNIGLKIGESTTVNVTVKPDNADNKDYFLTSSNEEIVKVNGNILTGVLEGTAYITVTAIDDSYKLLTKIIKVSVNKDGVVIPETDNSGSGNNAGSGDNSNTGDNGSSGTNEVDKPNKNSGNTHNSNTSADYGMKELFIALIISGIISLWSTYKAKKIKEENLS